MAEVVFVLGGARSGKSRYAQSCAERLASQRIFVATAEPFDDEMAQRIARHQADRGQGWKTVEAPLDVASAISVHACLNTVCLVDCLTLWLSNVMHTDRDVASEIKELCLSFLEAKGPVVVVSNEVGLGLVPETPLGRDFRDAQGWLNQEVAAMSDRVEFIAAGLPITLKS
ncbi:MAG: bifunctional adenosylcobinamide kinase/adenosylcobinamide-phosphate guanylyltransferase [Pseudomonadota bacterium]